MADKGPQDEADRIMMMDQFAVRAWNQKTIPELRELREKLYHKISILSKESVVYVKELEKNLKDLDDYILIRENRENKNNSSDILV